MMTWIILFYLGTAQAGTDVLVKAQELTQSGQSEQAIVLLQDELKKENNNKEEKKLFEFENALISFNQKKYELAIAQFDTFLKEKSSLSEYAHYYLAQAQYNLHQNAKAKNDLELVLKENVNLRLKIDSSMLLGQILVEEKNYKKAKDVVGKLEKRTRGNERYPDLLYLLSQIELGLHNKAQACKSIKKLYAHYPAFDKIANWGPDLNKNEIDGHSCDCATSADDFKTRMKNLMWSGLDQKAQNEINLLKERMVKTNKYQADQIQAQYYLHEGEVSKALDLLKPYYEEKKREFNFLILFGSAAARSGEVQLAVGCYYNAYKMSPRSKLGRQALYQSAFLSYQFQDYDGASRRFKEFMKVYPNSGLTNDAKWHMAWLKYLKGDYENAYKEFASQQVQRKRVHKKWQYTPSERSTYWMAMSRYRMKKYEQAKGLFESLTKDKLYGYYSIAAQARLKKLANIKIEEVKSTPKSTFVPPRAISRFSANEFLTPSLEPEMSEESAESEESLIANQYETQDEDANEEASADEANPDMQTAEVDEDTTGDALEKSSPFSGQLLTKKFEQARDLMLVGLKEWARWDLYEIESKTHNRDYLRTLMGEYTTVGHYHRASYIAQIQFGSQRAAHGIEGVRYLWEYAYPKAYSEYVDKYTKDFSVQPELVWGIMRAESQYRKDAISPVGALGLMQVMPFTGHKVANLLGDKTFTPNQLLEPEVAIKFGSRYLKRLGDNFQNLIPLIAASYNAGPHRVKSWLASFGSLETDEFIEHIPFLETRNYVKRVMSNAQIYSMLYGNKKDLFAYLPDTIPVKYNKENVAKENWDDI